MNEFLDLFFFLIMSVNLSAFEIAIIINWRCLLLERLRLLYLLLRFISGFRFLALFAAFFSKQLQELGEIDLINNKKNRNEKINNNYLNIQQITNHNHHHYSLNYSKIFLSFFFLLPHLHSCQLL